MAGTGEGKRGDLLSGDLKTMKDMRVVGNVSDGHLVHGDSVLAGIPWIPDPRYQPADHGVQGRCGEDF